MQLLAGSAISVSEDVGTLDECEVLVETSGDPGVLETMLKKSRAGVTLLLLGLPYADGSGLASERLTR